MSVRLSLMLKYKDFNFFNLFFYLYSFTHNIFETCLALKLVMLYTFKCLDIRDTRDTNITSL